MILTPNNITELLPTLTPLQITSLKRLLLQVRLDEYNKLRTSGWLDLNGEQGEWVGLREATIIKSMAEL